DRQKIFWRTIDSPNHSAQYDDGSVEFRRSVDGLTVVTIFTRQKFHLPPVLASLHVENHPALYEALVAAAYNTFVIQTARNLQQKAEGRPYRIGHPPRPADRSGKRLLSSDTGLFMALAAGAVTQLFKQGPALANDLKRFFEPRLQTQLDGELDERGFRHFSGN